jgi:predicted nucleotidyltransferase
MGTTASSLTAPQLSSVLFGKTRNAVLGLLFSHPDESFYVREIVRAAKAGLGSVQRELNVLEQAGIIQRTTRGRQVFYQANRQGPIFEELKGLVLKTTGVAEVLVRALAPVARKIRIAFVYGSMARGQQQRSSDVDLFVIGDITFADVVEVLAPAQRTLGREINPTVYPASEFRQKLSQKHHFITSVLRGPKLFLIGDERELAGLGGTGLDSGT